MSQIILDSANDLIQGDFDNATLTQRTRLQTSTVNATTGVISYLMEQLMLRRFKYLTTLM